MNIRSVFSFVSHILNTSPYLWIVYIVYLELVILMRVKCCVFEGGVSSLFLGVACRYIRDGKSPTFPLSPHPYR